MAEQSSAGGDLIEGNVKDSSGTAIGSNIEQVTHAPQASNAVTIYNQPAPATRIGRRRRTMPMQGEIMADAAQMLWQAIADLSGTIGELKASVETNSRATERQSESILQLSRASDDQIRRTELQFKAVDEQIKIFGQLAQALRAMKIQIPDDSTVLLAPARPIPAWQPYATPTILSIMLLLLIFYMATGGKIP